MFSRLGLVFLLTSPLLGLLQPAVAAPLPGPPPRNDIFGDPLPAGAIARLGSIRLRHADALTTLACSPDGKWLASHCRWESFVSVWETGSGKLRHRLPASGVVKMAFAADGNTLALIVATSAFSAEILVECWNLATGVRMSRYRDEERCPEDAVLTFSPEGKSLWYGRSSLRRLDWAAGKVIYELPMGQGAGGADAGIITALAVTPDGATLIGAEGANRVCFRDAGTGKEQRAVDSGGGLALSPDGKILALATPTGPIEIWQLPRLAGQEPNVMFGKHRLAQGHTSAVIGLSFSPDGNSLVSLSAQGEACLWDVTARQLLVRRQLPVCQLGAAVFDQARRPVVFLAAKGAHGLSAWDVATGKELFGERRLGNLITCLTFSPDGKTLGTGSDNAVLRFWRAGTGDLLGHVTLPGAPCQIDFSADGKNLVAGGSGKWWSVAVSPGASGDALLVKLLGAPAADSIWQRVKAHDGRALPWKLDLIDEGTLTPDGFVINLKRNHVHVSEGSTGKKSGDVVAVKASMVPTAVDETVRTGSDKFSAAALAPNRRTIAVVQNDNIVAVVEVAGFQEVDRWTLDQKELTRGQPWLVPRVAFAPGGRLLAAGMPRGSILFYDLATSQQIHKLAGHDAPVSLLAFAPDGRSLACAYRDATVLVWDLSAVAPKPPAGPQPSLDESWLGLESVEAAAAWKAHWALVQGMAETVAHLKERLKPVRVVKLLPAGPLIKDLDSPLFAVRQRATKGLEEMGQAIEPELRQALEKAANLEVQRRLQSIVAKVEAAQRRQIQELRAVAVLEQIATAESTRLLETLAAGDPQAPLTLAARAALKRHRQASTAQVLK